MSAVPNMPVRLLSVALIMLEPQDTINDMLKRASGTAAY